MPQLLRSKTTCTPVRCTCWNLKYQFRPSTCRVPKTQLQMTHWQWSLTTLVASTMDVSQHQRWQPLDACVSCPQSCVQILLLLAAATKSARTNKLGGTEVQLPADAFLLPLPSVSWTQPVPATHTKMTSASDSEHRQLLSLFAVLQPDIAHRIEEQEHRPELHDRGSPRTQLSHVHQQALWMGLTFLRLLQGHRTGVFFSHFCSLGQTPGWHVAEHRCPQDNCTRRH